MLDLKTKIILYQLKSEKLKNVMEEDLLEKMHEAMTGKELVNINLSIF